MLTCGPLFGCSFDPCRQTPGRTPRSNDMVKYNQPMKQRTIAPLFFMTANDVGQLADVLS